MIRLFGLRKGCRTISKKDCSALSHIAMHWKHVGGFGIMVVRLLYFTLVLGLIGSFSGCCGPTGRITQCNGCNDSLDGGFGGGCQAQPTSLYGSLMNARRQLVCGSGCGEAYYGEWISTPPDAQDPCCGGQFVGGATKCQQPFCWQPGTIFGNLGGLYGSRNCDFRSNAFSDLGGGCACDDCCGGGEWVDEGYVDGGYVEGEIIDPGYAQPVIHGGGGGCSTCSSNNAHGNPRVARTRSARNHQARNHQVMTQHYYQQGRTLRR